MTLPTSSPLDDEMPLPKVPTPPCSPMQVPSVGGDTQVIHTQTKKSLSLNHIAQQTSQDDLSIEVQLGGDGAYDTMGTDVVTQVLRDCYDGVNTIESTDVASIDGTNDGDGDNDEKNKYSNPINKALVILEDGDGGKYGGDDTTTAIDDSQVPP